MISTLAFTPAVARATDHLYAKVKAVVPRFEWELHAPLIARIHELKREKRAVILGHNYQIPSIFHGISDITGDSLQLSRAAAKECGDALRIVFCGVHFMAETAKLLNPGKKVLIPDLAAGCSLSESMSAADVRELKRQYPGRPAVCYINTPAAVKAECDLTCTSGNAVEVVESLGASEVIFVPDEYLAKNVAAQTGVKLIGWHGRCIVHEEFSAAQLGAYRRQFPDLTVLAHPECSPEVVAAADYVGSTSGMIAHLDVVTTPRVLMVTECSMADNVQSAHPELEFVKTCSMCPHMKRITLEGVVRTLERDEHEVTIPPEVEGRARRAIERMLEIPLRTRPR